MRSQSRYRIARGSGRHADDDLLSSAAKSAQVTTKDAGAWYQCDGKVAANELKPICRCEDNKCPGSKLMECGWIDHDHVVPCSAKTMQEGGSCRCVRKTGAEEPQHGPLAGSYGYHKSIGEYLLAIRRGEPGSAHRLGQLCRQVCRWWCIADVQALGCQLIDTPLPEGPRALRQALLEEYLELMIDPDDFTFPLFLGCLHGRSDGHAHAAASRKLEDGLAKSQVSEFHQELNGVAVPATAEAVIEPLRCTHGERRCVVGMIRKRAAGHELLSGATELHIRADHVNNVGSFQDVRDKCLW